MRLLIVEDEVLLAAQVDRFLRENDFVVDMAGDGEEGLYYAREYAYDAAVIDLGLPKLTGIDLIRTLRREGNDVPVLILTARSDWRDKVGGLEAGADDYLTKPFHMEELLARVKVLIRRAAGFASSVIEHGPMKLDTSSKEVRIAGALVELTAFEYRLLEFLALNPSRVVSKAELTEHLYEQDFDRDSNVIEVFIGRLRRKLDPAGSLKPIRTVRGQGYRFALALDA
ncbi:MAG: response regulator transcription factor [Gammaproteobacteria bacterium]|nr:response regulator transcription factor [Gammaproteobacteria bacterium]MXY58684.1 response regulator transcription factor [Gammaproteobacteria bacterium]MYF30215.1 response regulator transcription factor [Gammaproteobacteria bacterium]MYK46552.1 response regulator transcription factor [Gammaproteobacteria bacterium]